MLVTLPSGARAPLEVPGLLPLLAAGGSTLAVARAALAHDEVDVEALSPEDVFLVARWALREFASSSDAIALSAVCEVFGEPPSRRLGISDRILAWTFDRDCMYALKEARLHAAAAPPGRPEEPPDGVLVYSVPDTWTGDDDE